MPTSRALLALLSAVILMAANHACAELYRYTNERGVVVLDRQGVPPQHVARGQEVPNARGNLQSLRSQHASFRQQAANHERSGRRVPENLLAQIANLEQEQAGLQRDLQRYEAARAEAESAFSQERQRVAELLGDR